jgi:very-short-patch-repair endonuclease
LWRALRNKTIDGLRFRHQAPIGDFIVDFFCPEAKLVIEIDGVTHVDEPKDKARDRWFQARGYTVLRFWNNEVMGNLQGVPDVIQATARPPHPGPPPQGGREKAR